MRTPAKAHANPSRRTATGSTTPRVVFASTA
jgi:hypothetical protein